jgi:hypothetical protein
MDVTANGGQQVITSYQLRCCDVENHWERWPLRFRLKSTHFGVESRRLSTGQIPLAVRTLIKIEELSKYRGALWRVAVEL